MNSIASTIPLLLALVPLAPGGGEAVQGALGVAPDPAPSARVRVPVETPGQGPRAARRLLVHGGRIRLGDGAVVSALLVEDGRVVAVGPEDEVRARLGAAPARELDLRGATAVPGLQDAHVRLGELGATLAGLDLRGVGDAEQLLESVAAHSAGLAKGAWVVGHGLDLGRWEPSDWPVAGDLDAAAPGHPVLLHSADRGAALVSGRALELARIGKREQDAPRGRHAAFGRVVRDGEGRPTGLLEGEAVQRVAELLPEPTRAERIERILLAADHLLARGVTCAHDMGTSLGDLELYRELLEAGRLRLRLVCYVGVSGVAGASDTIEAARAAASALPFDARDRLAVAGVAIRLDGSLSARGAALLEPYEDRPGERGRLLIDEGRLGELLAEASRAGLQPAVRATGDLAARLVLDTFRKASALDPAFPRLRPRIEDGLLVAPRDWPRIPELGAALVALPGRPAADGSSLTRVGPDRWRRALAWRRLAPHLGPQAFGSGAPEGEAGPLLALHGMRTATALGFDDKETFLPEELPDGRLALAGCTRAAAWAARQEDRRGRLLPGYGADLTVLSVDPVECAPGELRAARVLATLVNGELVGGEALARAGR